MWQGVPLKRAVAGVAMGLLLPDALKRGVSSVPTPTPKNQQKEMNPKPEHKTTTAHHSPQPPDAEPKTSGGIPG